MTALQLHIWQAADPRVSRLEMMEPDQPVQPWLQTPPDQTNEALDITPNVALWRAVL